MKSLVSAFILDRTGKGKPIGWNEVASWTPEQGLLWVHLNFTTKKAKQWLRSINIDKLILNAITSEESRSRCFYNLKSIVMILRGVNLNPGQDPEDMISIRVLIDEHMIITTRRRSLLSIEDMREAIREGVGPKTSSEFIIMLNEFLLDRLSDVVNQIEGDIDELEENVMTAENRTLRTKISEIRRMAIELRRFLSPQREALSKLQSTTHTLLNDYQRLQVREINDRLIRHIEALDSARDRATILQEELQARISERLETRMYVLSIVSLIFMPITFLTGLLGMNVGGLPGLNEPTAFWLVCGGLFCTVAAFMIALRIKKWL